MKQTVPRPPRSWPASITHINQPVYSKHLTSEELASIRRPTALNPSSTTPTSKPRTRIQTLTDPAHPAYTQQGLFTTQHLAPSTFILPYIGFVHSPRDTDPSSDYDLTLDREHGIAIDASTMGNEARFINDYRGVPGRGDRGRGDRGPNAEFRDVWMPRGDGSGVEEKGIGVFVLSSGRAGKRASGIGKGEEILVSYGKGFWSARGET